jgi:hypothetical protein
MNAFVQRHLSAVTGMLSGFDRVRFRGTLRMLAHTGGFASFLRIIGVKLKDFGSWADNTTRQLNQATEKMAEAARREVLYLPDPSINKEEFARSIAQRDGITQGLVCVLKCVEPCFSYNLRKWGSPELKGGIRKCSHYYHYLIDPYFGWINVRVQSWMPLTMHICINGREWLARRMDPASYIQSENCFTHLADPHAAQQLFDQMQQTDWPGELNRLAAAANPVHPLIFARCQQDYYWSAVESEWATDVMFKDAAALARVYPHLIRHGMLNLGSEEVLRFLGRKVTPGKIHSRLAAEVNTDLRRRIEGVRLKHRVGPNSIKMYDKQGSVLRVETTINQPKDMKVYRPKEGDEQGKKDWRYLRKGVADLFRRGEVCQQANERYLAALAAVDQPVPLGELTESLCQATQWHGGRARGLNPLAKDDAALLRAVSGGQFTITGFRNRDLRNLLYPSVSQDPKETRQRCGAVTRQLRLLRAHGLIRKVPKSHRYLMTNKGRLAITALLTARAADTAKLAAAA